MAKYITYRVRIISMNKIVEMMHKDTIEARAQVADLYDVDFDDTEVV